MKFAIPKGGKYFSSVFLAVLQGLSAVALLACSAWLISRAAEKPALMYLSVAIVGVRAFALARSSLRYAERLLSHDAVLSHLTKLRPAIFQALVPKSPAGFGKLSMGQLSANLVSDVDELQNLPLRVVTPAIQSIFVSIASTVLVWFILPQAALAVGLSLIFAFVVSLPLANSLSKRVDEQNSLMRARLAEKTLELLEHQDLLHQFDWYNKKLSEMLLVQNKTIRIATVQAVVSGISIAIFSLASGVSSILALSFANQAVTQNQLPRFMLAVLALAPIAIFEIASNVTPVLSNWRRYRSSAKKIKEILKDNRPREISPKFGHLEMSKVETVELANVSANFPGTAKGLRTLNLSIKKGDSISVMAPSGAGKSTLAMVLLRFLDIRDGSFRINGERVSRFSENSFRSRVGYLEQNPIVFNASVAANLRIAKPNASDSELVDVLKSVKLWSMFSRRGGLSCILGDQGVLISGGEAARIGIARVLLANFDLLVLDEPTANVDTKTSTAILKSIINLASRNNQIVVIMTHDLNVAKLTNRKFLLQN